MIAAFAFAGMVTFGDVGMAQQAGASRTLDSKRLQPLSKFKSLPSNWSARTLKETTTDLMSGRFALAKDSFTTTLANAENEDERQATAIKWINLLGRTSQTQHKNVSLQRQVQREYETIMRATTGKARRLAGNNLGFAQLRAGDNEKALQTLRQVEAEYAALDDGFAKAGFFYNLSLANERQGKIRESLANYQTAALSDPKFQPPLRAVLRNLVKLTPNNANRRKLNGWIGIALDRRDFKSAKRALLDLIAKSARQERLIEGREIALLLRYFGLSDTTAAQFEKAWAPRLEESPAENSKLSKISRELRRAFLGTYPVRFRIGEEGAGRDYFRTILEAALGDDRIGIVSNFLRAVGDTYTLDEKYDQALQRYATAWSLNWEDLDAALASAYFLVEQKPELDPEGSHLRGLIRQLFAGKGEVYIGGQTEKIYRFQTVLGSIFVRQRNWGANGRADGAIFQLSRAIRAHAKLTRRSEGEMAPIPILHRDLAIAYQNTDRPRDAYSSYLNAADAALKTKNKNLARQTLSEARSLSGAANRRQKERYKRLGARL